MTGTNSNVAKRPGLAQELDDIGSPSDGSTPDRPLVRKSSLTFASLPAREPLTTKKSFGTRESRSSHLDQTKNSRSSYFGKQNGVFHPASTELRKNDYLDQVLIDIDDYKEVAALDTDQMEALAHSKLSTQRLHEKIDMLGRSQAPRLSKPVPSAAALASSSFSKPEAPVRAGKEAPGGHVVADIRVDEDDSWITPLETVETDDRPPLTSSHNTDVMESINDNDTEDEMEFDMRAPELIAHEERMRTPIRISPSPGKVPFNIGHVKSASTITLASPEKVSMASGPALTKSISVSNPPYPSTTPKGSPQRMFHAPLSASKSKLQSIMRTAKGLFTSSAGVSAAAKMETLSPKALKLAANNMPGLYPNITGMLEDKPLPPSPPKVGRRTRSSTEREKDEKKKERDLKDRQRADDQLKQAREKENQSAAQFKAGERNAQAQTSHASHPIRKSPGRAAEEYSEADRSTDTNDMPPPAVPSVQSKAPRPVKPRREFSKKDRPQPVSIRVASTLSQRMPISTNSLASSLQETLPPTNGKQTVASKKTSNASLNCSASSTGLKTSVISQAGKPRALLAAERKREADEREAQRKLEQKREAERKRAAQQEETRRQDQKQRCEAERKERERSAAEQAKKNAQQEAIEKRRLEQTRKMEQQRNANAINDLVSSLPSPTALFH